MLGISCGYHDSAAALVVDGAIACAIQEERLSRIKNDPALPAKAAAACLRHAGLVAGDIDRVVFYEEPFDKLERVLVSTLAAFPRALRQWPRAIRAQLGHKIWVLDHIAEALGVSLRRQGVTTTDHHRAHAASAFHASPYDRAAVLTVDGVGEATSTAMWRGDASGLVELGRIDFPHSLGLLYAGLTAYLGFEVNEGEYKVMGLAAYGSPDRYRDAFARLVRLAPDGSFELDTSYFADMTDSELGFGPRLEQLLGPRRWTTREWDVAGEDRRYADIAATLQAVTEDALLAVAREARRRTGADALCLAGGVALNAVANARLARDAGFARVFVQPAAGDAGGALGRGDPRRARSSATRGRRSRPARSACPSTPSRRTRSRSSSACAWRAATTSPARSRAAWRAARSSGSARVASSGGRERSASARSSPMPTRPTAASGSTARSSAASRSGRSRPRCSRARRRATSTAHPTT